MASGTCQALARHFIDRRVEPSFLDVASYDVASYEVASSICRALLAGVAGKVGDVVSSGVTIVSPLAERAVSAGAPIAQAGVAYAQRTVVPVAEGAFTKVGRCRLIR